MQKVRSVDVVKKKTKYYDRSRKPSFNGNMKSKMQHKCALEHD